MISVSPSRAEKDEWFFLQRMKFIRKLCGHSLEMLQREDEQHRAA